jgi:hypothetical protein
LVMNKKTNAKTMCFIVSICSKIAKNTPRSVLSPNFSNNCMRECRYVQTIRVH